MNIVFLRKSQILPFINLEENFFKNKKRNQDYILGRFITKFVAKNLYNKTDLDIIENKKPIFKNSDLNFSISHSTDIVAVAFDNNNVGLDIEFMKERDFEAIANYLNIKFFEKKEFYQYWTMYEAEYKSTKQKLTSFIFENYMCSLSSFEDIKNKLKIYELKRPINNTEPNELINLKLVIDSNKNENTLEMQEINTASLELLLPLALNIE